VSKNDPRTHKNIFTQQRFDVLSAGPKITRGL